MLYIICYDRAYLAGNKIVDTVMGNKVLDIWVHK